jgi:predicted nucleic acid-binding Zn ribbon protein
VQALWPEVAGPAVAAEAEPVSERSGVVTVACRAAVWANELELLGGDLRGRLNARLTGPSEGGPVAGLRFVVREP